MNSYAPVVLWGFEANMLVALDGMFESSLFKATEGVSCFNNESYPDRFLLSYKSLAKKNMREGAFLLRLLEGNIDGVLEQNKKNLFWCVFYFYRQLKLSSNFEYEEASLNFSCLRIICYFHFRINNMLEMVPKPRV